MATPVPSLAETLCVFVFDFFIIYIYKRRRRLTQKNVSSVGYETQDHKPTDDAERRRIQAAGGYVLNGRIDGGLAVSRALGDFE